MGTWAANIFKSSWQSLERLQSTTLRLITGNECFVNNTAIRNSSRLLTIRETVEHHIKKLKEKLQKSHFEHLKETSSDNSTKQRAKKRPLNNGT